MGKNNKPINEDKRRKNREGSQLDAMKRVRKEQPPVTKIIPAQKNERRTNNWRDLLEEDDLDEDEGVSYWDEWDIA